MYLDSINNPYAVNSIDSTVASEGFKRISNLAITFAVLDQVTTELEKIQEYKVTNVNFSMVLGETYDVVNMQGVDLFVVGYPDNHMKILTILNDPSNTFSEGTQIIVVHDEVVHMTSNYVYETTLQGIPYVKHIYPNGTCVYTYRNPVHQYAILQS